MLKYRLTPRSLTVLAFAGLVLLTSPISASAQSGRNDRGPLGDLYSYLRVASPKAELVARTARLNDRVRNAERGREISRSDASGYFKRLDRVRDFIRDDRNLSRDEFRRRDGDLDSLERDLDRKLDRRDVRSQRSGRDRDRDGRDRDDRNRDHRY